MARIGSFSGGGDLYGRPLSIVHPKDNNVDGARYSEVLRSASLKLTDVQRDDLQREIDDLFNALRAEQDLNR